MDGQKTEISMRGVTSIQATGMATRTVHTAVSIFPWAMATIAQSSLSGIVPPCSHLCSGVQTSVADMNSQMANNKTPVARKRLWRLRRLIKHFLSCKLFAI